MSTGEEGEENSSPLSVSSRFSPSMAVISPNVRNRVFKFDVPLDHTVSRFFMHLYIVSPLCTVVGLQPVLPETDSHPRVSVSVVQRKESSQKGVIDDISSLSRNDFGAVLLPVRFVDQLCRYIAWYQQGRPVGRVRRGSRLFLSERLWSSSVELNRAETVFR